MNILLINGSPKGKKSNTYRLASAFKEGLLSRIGYNSKVEELLLNQMEIKPCLGCFSCWNKTPGSCVIHDDMKTVIEKLLWADITIWSFPLYYFGVPGPLKMLIDRQLPMVLPFMVKDSETGSHPSRYDMSGKRHVLVSTCGFYTTHGNYESVRLMFDHVLGKDHYETIFCSQGELFRVPELAKRTDEYLGWVKQAGAEYADGKITDQTRTELDALLFAKETFEAMADASWGVEKETGAVVDESFTFTKQMAALYNKASYSGKDIIVEMYYTDLDKRYQLVLSAQGAEVIDNDFRPYTTRIETPYTVWKDIACGKISGEEALMQQKYKVQGDFSLMMHWDTYFGETGSAADPSTPSKGSPASKTNMLIMLVPWIVFWVAASIETITGSMVSVAVCAMMPLVFYRDKKTRYDVLSIAAVSLFGLALIAGSDPIIILPLSYLCFGLMWLLSCLTPIPLSAHYSANDYNGEKAFGNPLFIKTNAILTAMWGILYVITAIMTYVIIQTELASYLAIINNILPIFMGVFTAWFQKWYPQKVARGK